MSISPEALAAEAQATVYRPDVLENTVQFLNALSALTQHQGIHGNLELKGGTSPDPLMANTPRLSVDFDPTYGGAPRLIEMRD